MKPEFGNLDQINLLQLEAKYKDMKPAEWVDCDCGCPHCEAELEKCPYCGHADMDQFLDDVCRGCKKEAIPYRDNRALEDLRKKVLITKS